MFHSVFLYLCSVDFSYRIYWTSVFSQYCTLLCGIFLCFSLFFLVDFQETIFKTCHSLCKLLQILVTALLFFPPGTGDSVFLVLFHMMYTCSLVLAWQNSFVFFQDHSCFVWSENWTKLWQTVLGLTYSIRSTREPCHLSQGCHLFNTI